MNTESADDARLSDIADAAQRAAPCSSPTWHLRLVWEQSGESMDIVSSG